MRLWRVLPTDASAADRDPGGALWFPRELQGSGRHDCPRLYGCLYVAEDPVAAIAEALAPFRNSGPLEPDMLLRAGRALTLAEIDLAEGEQLIDLDDPRVLVADGLRPSVVATRHRTRTQGYAERLYNRHPDAAGLRWWSTLEASWINVTLFDRAAERLVTGPVTGLTPEHPDVRAAAGFLGLG